MRALEGAGRLWEAQQEAEGAVEQGFADDEALGVLLARVDNAEENALAAQLCELQVRVAKVLRDDRDLVGPSRPRYGCVMNTGSISRFLHLSLISSYILYFSSIPLL